MITTSSLFNIVKSELILAGKNEFFNGNQITMNDDNFAFIKKMMNYDKDVHKIVSRTFFSNFTFTDAQLDEFFKKAFMNRFLNREIGRQTVEDFATQVVYVCLTHEKYIENLYKNFDKFVAGESQNTGTNTKNGTSDYRNLVSTLPQDEINLNVNDTELDYGDTNTISRSKDVGNDTSNSTSQHYSPETLQKMFSVFDAVFNEIDRKCFLQIW